MSAADSEGAIDRLAAIRGGMSTEDFATYAFLVLGLLGWQSPEVLQFLLDRADEKVGAGR